MGRRASDPRTSRRRQYHGRSPRRLPPAEYIINWLGVSVAIIGTGVGSIGYVTSRYDNLRDDVVGVARETRQYFVQHVSEHVAGADAVDADAAAAIDRDAVAILEGAGPETLELTDGKIASVADEFSVDSWKIVRPVFPDGDRLRPDAICGIDEHGRLVVRGFSREREAALVSYSTDEDTAGVPCETDTFFFVRDFDGGGYTQVPRPEAVGWDVRLTVTSSRFGLPLEEIRLNAINLGDGPVLFDRVANLRVNGGNPHRVRLFAQGVGQDQILAPQETAEIGLADSKDATRSLPGGGQFDCELEYYLREPGASERETHRFSFFCETLPRD